MHIATLLAANKFGNAMPPQEPGARPARPLPVQPNANLTGFTTAAGVVTAQLAFSNSGPYVRKADSLTLFVL